MTALMGGHPLTMTALWVWAAPRAFKSNFRAFRKRLPRMRVDDLASKYGAFSARAAPLAPLTLVVGSHGHIPEATFTVHTCPCRVYSRLLSANLC